jgi:hypothetical protein
MLFDFKKYGVIGIVNAVRPMHDIDPRSAGPEILTYSGDRETARPPPVRRKVWIRSGLPDGGKRGIVKTMGPDVCKKWGADIDGFVSKADMQWPEIKGQ